MKLLKQLNPLNIVLLTIAGIINAFGVTVFLSPVRLYDSGISGTAMLLSQLTPDWMSLSLFLLLFNIPLFCTDYVMKVRCSPVMRCMLSLSILSQHG